MNEPIDLYTIIIVITFLAVLIGVAYFLRTRKEQIQAHFYKEQKLKITNSIILGYGNKASILNAYNNDYLVVTGKNQAASIILLSKNDNNNKNSNIFEGNKK